MASRRHSDLASAASVATTPIVVLSGTGRPQDRLGGADLGPGRPAEVRELPAEPARGAGEQPRRGVVHATGGVERHQGGDADAVGEHRAGRADPTLHPAGDGPGPRARRTPGGPHRHAPRPPPARRTPRRAGTRTVRPAGGRTAPPPGTMGTTWWGCSPTTKPTWRSASQAMAPSAAARPKALPPERHTAWTCCTRLDGSSRSVSRVPGPPPRTSTLATVAGRREHHRRAGQPAAAPALVVADPDARHVGDGVARARARSPAGGALLTGGAPRRRGPGTAGRRAGTPRPTARARRPRRTRRPGGRSTSHRARTRSTAPRPGW